MTPPTALQLPLLDVPRPLIHGGRCFRRDAVPPVLTRSRLATLVASGEVREVVRGVFVDARAPDTPDTWLDALRLAVPPGAVVAGRSAAWAHGVDVRGLGPPAPSVVECVASTRPRPGRRAGLRSRGEAVDGDVTEVGGVPCTTPLRTAVDLLFQVPRPLALAAADAMAHAGAFTADALAAAVERHADRTGFRRARRLAAACEPLAESFGESHTRLRILDAGFPRPVAQVPLGAGGRVEFRIDLGYPWLRVGVEYDGLEHHSTARDLRADEARRARIRDTYGWTLLVAGRGDVLGRSMHLELALGEVLGQEPRNRRRTW